MKMWDAVQIMNGKLPGYMVSFEHLKDRTRTSDHFPDKHAGEELISTEAEAWELARRFAQTAKDVVNVYVVRSDFVPVVDYQSRILNKHPL